MGFSSQQYHKERQERPWKINPVWRGIGCVLFLIVPIMAWFGAVMLLQGIHNIVLPWQLTRIVAIPFTHIAQIDRLITPINQYFQTTKFQLAQLFFTIIFVFLGYGVIAFLYGILYKMAGPPRYGPFDVPANTVKRYKH